MKSCFAYVRVSTVKQGDGVSLEAQREAIEAFAVRHDLTVAKWFEEKETAAKRGRPIFNKMMGELMRGKASGLIVHKIDRSARNFGDWAKIGDLADAGIDIHFANENLDFRSRGGRLTADIQAVIAADYIRNLREETIKGINGRLKQGLYPFGAPLGYLDNGGGKPKTIDPLRGPLVRTLFELYASGEYPLWALQREMKHRSLTNRRGRPLTKSGIAQILSNPFYAGVIEIKRTGQVFAGIHEPLISPALLDRVTAVRTRRDNKKITKHNHRFRGLFRCALCNTAMIGERQKGHVYYRCHTPDCDTKSVQEQIIEGVIVDLLRQFSLDESHVDALRQRAAANVEASDSNRADRLIDFELVKLDEKQSRLTDKLIDGVIDDATFQHKEKELLLERKRMQELAEQHARAGDRRRRLEKILELAKNLYLTYQMAADAQKREIVKFATSNRIVHGKNAYLEPQKWLRTLKSGLLVLGGAPDSDASRTDVREALRRDRVFETLLELETPPIDALSEEDFRDAA